jgi:hypothetical protein
VTNTIITHGGGAHFDEMLAVGLVCRELGEMPVHRCWPTDAERDDPNTWVLDVGKHHEPELRNFDHHKVTFDEPECAFSLVARHLGLHELLSARAWYPTQVQIDTQGIAKTSRALGLDRAVPGPLGSPTELALIWMWMDNDGDQVRPEVVRMVTAIADALVAEAEQYIEELPRTAAATEVRHVQGIPVMVHDCTPHDPVSSQLRDEWHQAQPGEIVALSVSHDRRDDGLAQYRFDDDLTSTCCVNAVDGDGPRVRWRCAGWSAGDTSSHHTRIRCAQRQLATGHDAHRIEHTNNPVGSHGDGVHTLAEDPNWKGRPSILDHLRGQVTEPGRPRRQRLDQCPGSAKPHRRDGAHRQAGLRNVA